MTEERGWRRLRFVSTWGTGFNRDYGAETEDGAQMPMAHVWRRGPDGVRHLWSSELLWRDAGDWPHHARHVDMIRPLWNIFDLSPEGRPADWFPALSCD